MDAEMTFIDVECQCIEFQRGRTQDFLKPFFSLSRGDVLLHSIQEGAIHPSPFEYM